ncbi:TolC family protein [Microbulbifer hainanensis]|uniref:TolC family protein n=1 Tax=Microbulbifer hainanensis TaxID=2735675 RepID=UPI001865C497|nr:TolC family protein [Microbulbifer hainanensis]
MRNLVYATATALAVVLPSPPAAAASGLVFEQAIAIAIERDPWLAGSRYTEDALADEALAAAQLPDPTVAVAALNMPTDTFNFGQEPMTQFALGISQMFPRGDSRALSRQQKEQLAAREPLMRADRRARVRATVAQLWLDIYRARESIHLIDGDRALFTQLVDAAVASYASAQGRARQPDVIRAQLELTRLDDRLTVLQQRQESAEQRLSEWVDDAVSRGIGGTLPHLEPVVPMADSRSPSDWYQQLRLHPAVLALEEKIDAVATGIDLAKQKYKPEWALKASYGYRGEDPMGQDRTDLLTLGVSFDLPLFTAKRQDRQLSAAVARTAATETERSLLLRQLLAQLQKARLQLIRLDQRRALYRGELLPQMREQAEASLAAYNNDEGDFAEAVRARIAELNTKIDALDIEVERLKTIAQLNYLLTQVPGATGEPQK